MLLLRSSRVPLLIILSFFLQFDLIWTSTSGTSANNTSDGSSASQDLFTCVRFRSLQRQKRQHHREVLRLKQPASMTKVKRSERASKIAQRIRSLLCRSNQTDQSALSMDIANFFITQFQQISAAKQKLLPFYGTLRLKELSMREQRLNRLLRDWNDNGLKAAIDAFGGGFDNKTPQLVDGANATADVSCLTSSGGSIIQYDACEYKLLSQQYVDILAIKRAARVHMDYCRIPVLPDSTACPTATTTSSEGPATAKTRPIIWFLLIPILPAVLIAMLCLIYCSTTCRERRKETETETEQTSVASESASLADCETGHVRKLSPSKAASCAQLTPSNAPNLLTHPLLPNADDLPSDHNH